MTPPGHEGHDLEPLEAVWRCCTCGVDIPRASPPPPPPVLVDAETDGSGLAVDVATAWSW